MAHIVGVFAEHGGAEAVVEQLRLNGVTQVTLIGAEQAGPDLDQQLHRLGVPQDHLPEYARRLRERQSLLVVQADALDLPMVQRALRVGQAIDIDLLPEAMP